MTAVLGGRRAGTSAYAGLDFIKAAFCPLDFNAIRFAERPDYRQWCKDDALAALEVANPLQYTRQFSYTDCGGNRKTGTQIITAHFGLAPKDFDLFLGLFTYLKRLPSLPEDGRSYMTADFLARQLSLPADGQASYLRLRSRLFRFSYVKYTNTAFWNPQTKSYDLRNFGFFNLASLSRVTESRRPIVFEWDPSFLRIVRDGTLLTFDYDLYRSLAPAMRRLYLIANRDGWNQPASTVFHADDFAIHQIGYSERPEFGRLRLQKLRRLLHDAEEKDLIRPCRDWGDYLQPTNRGPRAGQLALRWSRGPLLRSRRSAAREPFPEKLENDALYAQVCELRDEERKPISPQLYRSLVGRYGRERLQKHVAVVLAQKEYRPGSFTRSEVAALVDRLQHDHPEPDWYQDLRKAERLSPFDGIQPNQLSMDLYGTLFRE
jgi:hypothetical protein